MHGCGSKIQREKTHKGFLAPSATLASLHYACCLSNTHAISSLISGRSGPGVMAQTQDDDCRGRIKACVACIHCLTCPDLHCPNTPHTLSSLLEQRPEKAAMRPPCPLPATHHTLTKSIGMAIITLELPCSIHPNLAVHPPTHLLAHTHTHTHTLTQIHTSCGYTHTLTLTKSVGLATMMPKAPVVKPAAIFRCRGGSPLASLPT